MGQNPPGCGKFTERRPPLLRLRSPPQPSSQVVVTLAAQANPTPTPSIVTEGRSPNYSQRGGDKLRAHYQGTVAR